VRADDELVTAAKSGDAAAWRELYRDHAGRLLLWLQARDGGGEAPDDIAAATWLVAAEKIADFHGSGSDFGGWLFGIARKHKANAGRRTATRAKGFDTLAADAEQTVASPETGILADEWVREALSALPPRERDVIACTEVLDLDVSATAAALGMTAVAVRVARHRGLKRLRAHLSPQ
jgi:RNA polymerase sigma-70 factor (ECF subfamily)